MAVAAIATANLSKDYGLGRGLFELDLQVVQQEVFGFLGPNGAGKSTTSRCYREYSSGNKRKLGIVLAFMHQPPLLILDEPTSGLDPLNQQEFFALIGEAREDGATVFLSS